MIDIEGIDARVIRYVVKETEDEDMFDVTITVQAKNWHDAIQYVTDRLHPLATLENEVQRKNIVRAFGE